MRLSFPVLVVAAFVILSGCAVGVRTLETDVGTKSGQKGSFSNGRFAYHAEDILLRLALERALIESYHVQDMVPVVKTGSEEPGADLNDRMLLKATITPPPKSTWAEVCNSISMLSFSVIPCVSSETTEVMLSATYNSKLVKEKRYRIRQRSYNWLPLGLAGADYLLIIFAGGESTKQPEKIRVYQQIFNDFLPEVGHLPEERSL